MWTTYRLKLVYSKKYFNPEKNCFRAIQNGTNQTECSRLEQKSLLKLLVAEMRKQYEFLRRMYDAYVEDILAKKCLQID